MRIFSKFHDYYDSARSYGLDPNLVYERNSVEIKTKSLKFKLPREAVNYSFEDRDNDLRVGRFGRSYYERTHLGMADYGLKKILIGFCGKAYPVIMAESQAIYDPVIAEEAFPEPKEWKKWGRRFRKTHKTDGEEAATFLRHKFDLDINLFLSLRSPVFVVEDNDVIKMNPPLKDYQFYKAVNPVTAFQEISMFIGNFLTTREKMIEIEDKYRIAEHGFDEKSFRHPTRLNHLSRKE